MHYLPSCRLYMDPITIIYLYIHICSKHAMLFNFITCQVVMHEFTLGVVGFNPLALASRRSLGRWLRSRRG